MCVRLHRHDSCMQHIILYRIGLFIYLSDILFRHFWRLYKDRGLQQSGRPVHRLTSIHATTAEPTVFTVGALALTQQHRVHQFPAHCPLATHLSAYQSPGQQLPCECQHHFPHRKWDLWWCSPHHPSWRCSTGRWWPAPRGGRGVPHHSTASGSSVVLSWMMNEESYVWATDETFHCVAVAQEREWHHKVPG